MLIRLIRHRRASIALEFAMIAPVFVVLLMGMWDICRYFVVRQQVTAAAAAVVQSAEKLSITNQVNVTKLTAAQMQTAMTSVYAAVPGLSLGNGTGSFPGTFSVTLSSVVFLPLCQSSNKCTPASSLAQTPYTLWSSALAEGGSQLFIGNVRACGALVPVSVFPGNSAQLSDMTAPSSLVLSPQLVADVSYVYTPTFLLFLPTLTIWASATMPSSEGGTDQEITFDDTQGSGNVVSCNLN